MIDSSAELGISPELSPSRLFRKILISIIEGSPGSLASAELEGAMEIADMVLENGEIEETNWKDTVMDLIDPLNTNSSVKERMEVINTLVNLATISEQEKKELTRLTLTDPLTGVPNRRFLDRSLMAIIAEANRHNEDPKKSFVLLDLVKFREVNNRFGHSKGDVMLAVIAQALDGFTREGDLFARYGGDEFGMIVYHSSPEELESLINRFRIMVASIEMTGVDIKIGLHSDSVPIKPGRFETTMDIYNLADPKLLNKGSAVENEVKEN